MIENSGPMSGVSGNSSHSAAQSSAADSKPQSRALLSELAERVTELVKGLRRNTSMRESLEEVLEESERESQELSSQERLMLTNLLNFGGLKVSDVMVPRADIIAVEEQTSLSELIDVFREAQHSRLPVYRETLDDPLGMIHIKDILALVEKRPDGRLNWPQTPITKVKRELLFVPAAMPALDLLLRMQASRIHLALVVDEYGGTDGLVSIEDLVEQIVGEIGDEHDIDEAADIITRPDGKYDADARVTLEEFRERTGIDLSKTEQEEEVDTLGGLVAVGLGRVPVRGEIVTHAGLEFEILEADPRHAKRLRIRVLVNPAPVATG
jgi:CBS domain containing-hemolysin-like protein